MYEIFCAKVSKQFNAIFKNIFFFQTCIVCMKSLQVMLYIFQRLTAGAVGLCVFPLPVRVNVRRKTYFSFSLTFHFGFRSMTDVLKTGYFWSSHCPGYRQKVKRISNFVQDSLTAAACNKSGWRFSFFFFCCYRGIFEGSLLT